MDMEKIFKLKQNGTNVRTEIMAGVTTFMTMAYILVVNPGLLTGFAVGSPLWNGIFLSTCIASFVGMLVMAFLANKPFAMAPGMGLNAYFAIVSAQIAVTAGVSYTEGFQAGLCIILIEGLIFVALSVLNIREKIVEAIPLSVRLAIGPAIGLMLMNIGFGSNASSSMANVNAMGDFFGALSASTLKDAVGDNWGLVCLSVICMLVGLFAIIIMAHKGIKGAVLFGMLGTSVFYWLCQAIFLQTNPFESLSDANWLPPFGDMAETTLFKFNFSALFELGIGTVVLLIVTFCIIDMFDTIGTVIATANRAGMVDKDGNMPQMKETLLADAVGTVAGACTGTSTVTTFVESASGVEAGGRTGLTALTTGILFLACMFIAPIAGIIPAPATSAALIYVGILMLSGLKNLDLGDITVSAPAFIMLLAMPISGSIGHGIGLGLIAHTVIKVFTGKAKDVSVLTYILSALFLVKFFLAV